MRNPIVLELENGGMLYWISREECTMNGELMEKYAHAKDLYSHRTGLADVYAARTLFLNLGDDPGATDFVRRCDRLIEYAVGNEVHLGRCDGRPLRWKVLAERGRMRLLFAAESMFEAPYNAKLWDTSWQSCTLRRHLNGAFMKACFTPAEQARIAVSRLENPRSGKYYTTGGAQTADKLFLLSPAEAEMYLPHPEDRADGAWWWLRAPGCNLLSAVAVYADGSVYEMGIHVDYEGCGVRPAMWVSLRV